MDKSALILWTCLPAIQFNAYQLLSSLVVWHVTLTLNASKEELTRMDMRPQRGT